MYHPNSSSYSQNSNKHANAITPSTWFVNLYIFIETSLSSKLGFLFLLDSGASICGLNIPTCTILADQFLKCSTTNPQNDELKTLTVSNKAEVPFYSM